MKTLNFRVTCSMLILKYCINRTVRTVNCETMLYRIKRLDRWRLCTAIPLCNREERTYQQVVERFAFGLKQVEFC